MNALPFMLTIQSYLTSPLNYWFPVAFTAAVAVIAVLAMILMFGSFVGAERLRAWVRAKIYDVLMSIVLMLVFLAAVTAVFSQNVVQVFSAVGLAPGACTGSGSGTDLTSLATCDMWNFNGYVQTFNIIIFWTALRFSFVPQIDLSYEGPYSGTGFETKITPTPSALDSFEGYLLDALYTAFVISQVQLLLLGASLLLFSVLMSVGLISRLFVVTRSFGGALIALAMGLGIIYPLMVSIIYGYIDVGISSACVASVSGTPICLIADIPAILTLVNGVTLLVVGIVVQGVVGIAGISLPFLFQFFEIAGFVGVGLVIAPVLTFLMVDVFVIDFSQVVGERMDFMSLLTGII